MLCRTKFHKQTRERVFRIWVMVIDFVGAQTLQILFCVSPCPLLLLFLLWTIQVSAADTSSCSFIILLQGISVWTQCLVSREAYCILLAGRCTAVWKEAFGQELMFWHRAMSRTPLNRACLITPGGNSLLYHLHLITWSVTWMLLLLKVGLRNLWMSLTWRSL